jgi:hypothetical protein
VSRHVQIQQKYGSLPYRVVDDYDRAGAEETNEIQLDVVTMENAAYKVVIDPAHGAKILSMTHKPTGKEVIFKNPVLQPAALGRLNAWTSGGIEWNWPRQGHSAFTMQPMYVTTVDTEKGTMLRLYEFDREMNTTFQVDLFLDPNATDSKKPDSALWVHTTVFNTNPHPVDAYWWTNIGVPITDSSRALYPADYAIVNGPNGLFRVDYPMFADSPQCQGEGIPLNDSVTNSVDHSYPRNYFSARENFIRKDLKGEREWMGVVDTRTGDGLLHAQTGNMNGRKYWAWGKDPADKNRMEFLSAPGTGAYMELQAGIAPTQSQTFPIPGNQPAEWTESFMLLTGMDPAVAADTNYSVPVEAAAAVLEEAMPATNFTLMDLWMRGKGVTALTNVLRAGSGWGAVHMELLKVPSSSRTLLAPYYCSYSNRAPCTCRCPIATTCRRCGLWMGCRAARARRGRGWSCCRTAPSSRRRSRRSRRAS